VFVFSSLLSGASYSRVKANSSFLLLVDQWGLGMFYQTLISFKISGKKVVAFQELILVPFDF